MTIRPPQRNRSARLAPLLLLTAVGFLVAPYGATPGPSHATGVVPEIEIVEDEGGLLARLADYIKTFQRRANAEIAAHMTAI